MSIKENKLEIIAPKICTGIIFKLMKDRGVVFTPIYEEEDTKILLDSFRIDTEQLRQVVDIINEILGENDFLVKATR